MKKKIISLIIFALFIFILAACGLIPGTEATEDKPATVAAESLSVGQRTMTVYVSEEAKLKIQLLPENTTDHPEFTSSDDGVVTVDRHGNLTALEEGEAVITVSVGALRATCKVTVEYPPVTEIAFAETGAVLEVGEELELQITQTPEIALPQEYRFRSDDERIAVVDENGKVTARGVGNTCIYASLKENDSVRCILDLTTVCSEPTSLKFEEDYYSVLPDGTEALSLMVEPFGMRMNEVSWESSDESVVTVDQDGTITGHDRGIATVTARMGGLSAECVVGVTRRPAPDPVGVITEGRYTEDALGVLKRENAQDSGTARIMMIGDLMCLSAQQNAARSGGTYNFNSSFSIVKNIFAKSDFCIGNMETLVSYSKPYAAEQKEVNGNPNCNAPATYLDGIKSAGMDAVVMANNHCADGGEIGVYETLQQLNKYRIPSTGLFTSADARRYMIAEINGIKVGIASYTGHVNGGGRTIGGDRKNVMLNLYSAEKVQADVQAMKADGAEYIIAYMHWGTENTHSVNAKQKQQAQEIADAGVDFIAGSHPHCLQPAGIINAADGREVFCIYSMGNFVSSMGRTINNDTVIVNAVLKREGDKVVLAETGYIGCRVIGSYDGGSYVVVPNSAELNGGISTSALDSSRQRIAKVMDGTIEEITELN